MTDALEKTFPCETCEKWIRDIVMLVDHECDRIIPADVLSQQERSTLLYIESRIVDHGGVLDARQMNHEDRQNIKLFAAADLLNIETADIHGTAETCATVFTDAAWDLAAELRKHRGKRMLEEKHE